MKFLGCRMSIRQNHLRLVLNNRQSLVSKMLEDKFFNSKYAFIRLEFVVA